MKIAFVVNHYPPKVGGVQRHVQQLAKGLAVLGHEVVVLTLAEDTGARWDGNVEVLSAKEYFSFAEVISFSALGSRRRLTKLLRDKGIDVVSVHTRFFPMTFVGLRAAKAAGIPVVHTEHGSGFVASDSAIVSLGSRMVDLTVGRYVLRKADRVLAVSEESAAFVNRLSGVSAEVFYNAISPAAEGVEREERPNHLVFVGRMVPGKGWDVFLNTMARLRDQGFGVDGELLGAGSDLDAARKLAGELDLSELVEIPGQVSADRVRKSLAGATLVNPTVLSEGFQTTLLEAIAERGRVVTYPVPGAWRLQEQGMPVWITAERSVDALVESMGVFLREPPVLAESELIDSWTWGPRSEQYAEILGQVIEAH